MSKRIIQVFDDGAVLTTEDSMNVYDIGGKPPKKTVEATEKNINKYFKDRKHVDEVMKRDKKSKD
jgi:hypothetical protein